MNFMIELLLSRRLKGWSLNDLRNDVILCHGKVYWILIFYKFLSKNKNNENLMEELQKTVFF